MCVPFDYDAGPAFRARLGELQADGLRIEVVSVPDGEALAA